jgi:ribonuclease HI
VYAAAASPLGQRAMELASEGPRTKGPIAVFGVLLMFTMLAGGVFMLLQSSFGVKIGYLMTGTAFFGCWLVLSLLWLTGVPALPIPGLPRWGIPKMQRSTPQYTGPQGDESSWQLVDTASERRSKGIPKSAELIEADPADLTDQNLTAELTAAVTAGTEGISKFYAEETGAEQALITPNSTYVVDKVEYVRRDKKAKWVRLTTAPATPNASASEETLALIEKIKPETFELYFVEGDLANQTYYAVGIFTLLFALHAGLLARTDRKPTPQPQGAPERLVNA